MKLKMLSLAIVALALFAAGNFAGTGLKKAEAWPGADNIAIVSQSCLPDGLVGIRLTWISYSIGVQWMDLSHNNNNWVFGTFVGNGPFQPWETSFVPWYGIGGGRPTYVRINTFDGTYWYPSATIQFFTRNDCFAQPQVLDTDQDGLANALDLCPTAMGPYWASGCPATPANGMCDTVAMWCPGQAAPPARCAGQFIGCVWPTKGNGANYANGEQLTFCYWVNQPLYIYIDTVRPDGSTVVTLNLALDVPPHGNCFNAGNVLGAGQRQLRLYTGPSMASLQQLDTSTWVSP